MNTLFILGNGFDLNLKLKTKYSEFYTYYQKIKSESPIVKDLKKDMLSDYDSWADLEIAIGKYTQHLKSVKEYDELIEDIGENLATYLELQEADFDFQKINKESFFHYLCFPEKSLSIGQAEQISEYRKKWSNSYWYVNIVTLNYTRSVEKIIGDFKRGTNIGLQENSSVPISLLSLEHIHGYTDERMVIGVNDISQISNLEFQKEDDILESLVKTFCNKALDHKIERTFENQINDANLICIYGSSIGETDACWWETIAKRLKEDCRLIIFSHGHEVRPRVGHKNNRAAKKTRDLFLNRANLTEEEKIVIRDKIFVTINSKLFEKMINH